MTYCDSSIHHDPEKFMVVFFVSNFLLQNLHIFFKKKKKKFDFNQKRIFSVKKYVNGMNPYSFPAKLSSSLSFWFNRSKASL